eukprot:1341509-Alexandrium_andersonii.AAC.1
MSQRMLERSQEQLWEPAENCNGCCRIECAITPLRSGHLPTQAGGAKPHEPHTYTPYYTLHEAVELAGHWAKHHTEGSLMIIYGWTSALACVLKAPQTRLNSPCATPHSHIHLDADARNHPGPNAPAVNFAANWPWQGPCAIYAHSTEIRLNRTKSIIIQRFRMKSNRN